MLGQETLEDSFEDFKLSKDEKYSLRDLLLSLEDKNEMFAFTRNSAFDIYRAYHAQSVDHSVHGITWLEKVFKTIDNVRGEGSFAQAAAYFSPGEACAREMQDKFSIIIQPGFAENATSSPSKRRPDSISSGGIFKS